MKRNILWGLVFILVGVLLILQRTFTLDINVWNFLWPFCLIVPGVVIHYNYFSKGSGTKNLVIGATMVIYGIYFLFNVFTNWRFAEGTNYIYPFGVAVGFLEDYIFEKHKNSFLMSVILFAVSIYMFLKTLNLAYQVEQFLLPVIFIFIGLYLLFKRK